MIKSGPKIVRRGFQIYNKHKRALEAEHYREYVAIEVKSGEYFLGKPMDEATDVGRICFRARHRRRSRGYCEKSTEDKSQ